MEYFAYGSNMNAKRMRERIATFAERRHAVLHGYHLEFSKVAQGNPSKGYANIVLDADRSVEGVLYMVSQTAIDQLDKHEGYPTHYDRIQIPVITDDGESVSATVYVAQPQMVRTGLKPARDYIAHLLAGKDLLSRSYVQMLEDWPTID